MAKDGGQGGEVMGAAELKPLLHLAKRKPVSCAIGMTKDKQGVILLHKRTKPRKLMAELLRQAKGSGLELDRTTIRFGRASVDGGSDSSSVTFTVNKAAPGPLRMALVAKLRPAGFQRCEIVVDEKIEEESDEDEPEETETGAMTPSGPHQGTGSATTPDASTTGSSPAQPDAATLKATLRNLAEQIRPVVAADPSRAASLVKSASDARDSLAQGDLAATQAGIEGLHQQLEANNASPSPAFLAPALFSGAPVGPPGLASGEAAAMGQGAAEVAGPVLLRFAFGGFAFVAALVIPTNTQRVSRGTAVDGRPDMAGTVTTAPGSLNGRVTVRLHGQHGEADRKLGTFAMDPRGKLTDGGQGPVLGTVSAGGIHLTPEGGAELLKRAGGSQAPIPTTSQQVGISYETRDEEEANLAASLAGQGKSGAEIQAALDEHRRNAGPQSRQGGSGVRDGSPALSANNGPFSSDDPLVGDVANEIEAAKPGMVKGVNIDLFRPDGTKATDIDIQLDGIAVQVKSGSGKGLTRQMETTKQLTGLRTIAYGPDLGPTLQQNLRRSGFEVYTKKEDLLRAIGVER